MSLGSGGSRHQMSNKRNFALSSAADLLTTAASFGTGVLVARILGPEDRGVYSFVTATGAVVAYLAGMGLFEALLAKGRRPSNGVLWLAAGLGVVGSVVMFVVGAVRSEPMLQLYSPLPIIWGLLQVRLAHARITGRAAWFWLRVIAPALQLLTTLVLVVAGHLTVASAIAALLVGFAVAVVVDVIVERRQPAHDRAPELDGHEGTLLRSGLHQHLLNVPRSLNYRGPLIMLGFLATSEDLGLYAVAGSVASLIPILTWSIPQNLLAMRSAKDNAASRVSRQLVTLSWLSGAIGGTAALLLGEEVLALVYGSAFVPAVTGFIILTFAQAPWLHSSVVQADYRADGRAHVAAIIEVASLVVTLVLIALLYPIYGITGVASSVAAGYVLSAVLTQSLRYRSPSTSAPTPAETAVPR
ncbi:lipopolysaccharide biosynthesis protein [Janibacter melonis]|uniref:lipopolysaccharide biosynthesis protein n=2 Tax=Janibacter melonis TaxID=262209 RepID=UPI001E3153EC|nr:oligosaccharide flippase family protein [Janibacter melonis]MCB5990843.1 oligosaccharide flippase family protein [Janibacter melonis]